MLPERRDVEYASTKTYVHAVGLSCCFRQHKAKSHCRFLHGYALQVKITFQGELDENNWVMDFGGLKPIKEFLEFNFDHKLLVAADDPNLGILKDLGLSNRSASGALADIRVVEATGCEAFARMIFDFVDSWLGDNETNPDDLDVQVESVEVREHEANSAICRRK